MFDAVNTAILVGAGLVLVSAVTSLISRRIGSPLLLLFLAIGLLAGEDGLLGIEFDSGGAAYFIGSLALAVILFDSGFETPWRSYRVAAAPALTLATLGVVLTTALVGVGAHLLLGLGWIQSLLLGAIIASTDAAAVFFLLRVGGMTLRDRVKSTLEIESGANDPMAIFLTATLVELAAAGGMIDSGDGWRMAQLLASQIGLGLVCGAIGGVALPYVLNRLQNLEAALYPITALAAALVVFSATGLLGGSGFLAAYVAGLVAGNSRLRFGARLRRFQVGMTWIAQIGMFLTLGLLATPTEFGAVALPALGLAAVLIFVARPIAVWLCLMPFGFDWRERLFVGWVGLRGAVSILLAILPGLGGVTGGPAYFNIVFMMVLASLLIQGWTIALAARVLKLLAPGTGVLSDRIQLELPGNAEVELVGYRIHPDSRVAVGERVPRWARPILILRDGRAHSVHNAGPLRAGDHVYLFASRRQAELLDRIYARPGGIDEREIRGDFALRPDVTAAEVAREYGVRLPGPQDRTLGDLLARQFHGEPLLGDRMSFGHLDLVVRAVDDDGGVAEVGVLLSPEPRPRGASRLFRSLRGRLAGASEGV